VTDDRGEPTPSDPAERALRLRLAVLFVYSLGAYAAGVILFGPQVLYGLARHEPWLLAGILAGELTAFFWFGQYYATHFGLGEPLRDRPVTRPDRWHLYRAAGTLMLGLAVDFAFTIYAQQNEWTARRRAVPARGEVYRVEGRTVGRSHYADCFYRFTDAAGEEHDGLAVIPCHADGSPRYVLPILLRKAVLEGPLPAPITLTYDPEWPARSWADPLDGTAPAHLAGTCCGGLLQLIAVPALLIAAQGHLRRGLLPWWADLFKVVPFALRATGLLVVAVLRN
jgi:hypothetical protein